jgi:hypothetical protein
VLNHKATVKIKKIEISTTVPWGVSGSLRIQVSFRRSNWVFSAILYRYRLRCSDEPVDCGRVWRSAHRCGQIFGDLLAADPIGKQEQGSVLRVEQHDDAAVVDQVLGGAAAG